MTERLAYTVAEVAELLGVSVAWVERAIADGAIPVVRRRAGGKRLISRASLDAFLAGEPS